MQSRAPIKSVLVIGAGLGGLTFAQALKLKRPDIQVSVYERDTTAFSRNQGYQIGLNPDGITALRAIKLQDVEDLIRYNDANSFAITDNNLRVLMEVGGKSGDTPAMALINRWTLRDKLSQGVDIHWDKRLLRYEETPDKVVAHFDDGTSVETDILVGADGSRSIVRAQRCPSLTYDDIGIIQGAGHCLLPPEKDIPTLFPLLQRSAIRILLPFGGKSCLIIRFKGDDKDDRAVWAASQPEKTGTLPADPKQFKEHLLSHTDHYPKEFLELVKNTPDENILPAKNMSAINTSVKDPFGTTTRVTLLGDAAHAMTTHAGLGGNTALQDSIDLADALSKPDWYKGLSQYEPKMIARGFKNAQTSLNSTNSLSWDGWKASFRHYLMLGIGTCIKVYKKVF